MHVEAISNAPWWRALTPDELAHYGDVRATEATPTPGIGWQPAAFRGIIPGCGPTLIHGWVKPPFALHQAITDALIFGQITHLPTGNTVGTFWSVPEAAFAAAVLAPITDWSALTLEGAPALVDPVVDAIESVGFSYQPVKLGTFTIPVWRRGTLN
ncbi:hypothetical protein ACLBYG_21920 [Methylobacterium sp. D53M]